MNLTNFLAKKSIKYNISVLLGMVSIYNQDYICSTRNKYASVQAS